MAGPIDRPALVPADVVGVMLVVLDGDVLVAVPDKEVDSREVVMVPVGELELVDDTDEDVAAEEEVGDVPRDVDSAEAEVIVPLKVVSPLGTDVKLDGRGGPRETIKWLVVD